jgi:hypothetical protein
MFLTMYSIASNLDALKRSNPYVWDIRSPGKSEPAPVRSERHSLFASRRSSSSGARTLLRRTTETDGAKSEGGKTSVATLAQMGTALARLSDAALKIKESRTAAYESCGFAVPHAYADELAYNAERRRRKLQKVRAFIARPTETSDSAEESS